MGAPPPQATGLTCWRIPVSRMAGFRPHRPASTNPLHMLQAVRICGRVSISRFLFILAAFALMFVHMAMLGGGAAMASAAMASNVTVNASSPCHDDNLHNDHDTQKSRQVHDCIMTCSALTLPFMAGLNNSIGSVKLYHALTLFAFYGIEPKTELPPPRFP